MEMYIWNSVIVLSKVLFYLGFAGIAGYTFLSNQLRQYNEFSSNNKLTICLIVFALIANVLWFFAKTGVVAEEGIQGAFAPYMVSIMWNSSVGETILVRAIGLIVALCTIVLPTVFRSTSLKPCVKDGLLVISLFIIAFSFTLIGHVSELDVYYQALLMCHVLVMAWWCGALYPLKQACNVENDEKLCRLMVVFGKQASVMVSLLLLAGLLLAVELVGSFEVLFTSSYGRTLLIKLCLVIGILALASLHKLRLVPRLNCKGGRALLSKSITVEMACAIAILFITSALTSVVGPAN
ncbi:copper-binding protein [Thalassotalea sp. PP2-459]|nr:copper-binding protein [Thalassotalea sp. PP2-459]